MMMLGFGLGCWKLEKKKKKLLPPKGSHTLSQSCSTSSLVVWQDLFFFSGYHLAYGIVFCWLGSCPFRISHDIGDARTTWHPLFLILESQPDFL